MPLTLEKLPKEALLYLIRDKSIFTISQKDMAFALCEALQKQAEIIFELQQDARSRAISALEAREMIKHYKYHYEAEKLFKRWNGLHNKCDKLWNEYIQNPKEHKA